MKTLKDHLILFDAECPMCQLYTGGFVKSGLLEKDGRAAYQEYPAQACPTLDWNRAVNEIALVNQKTGEVTYGVESLFKILASAVPLLRPLFQFKPFAWLMQKLYAFISYNRRVIIPAPLTGQGFQFKPGFKKQYRIAYLVVTWFATAYILSSYWDVMFGMLPERYQWREFIICGGQIVFQALVIRFYKKEKTWEYLGNMMTISFGGALLLLPAMVLANLMELSLAFGFFWFMLVVGLMFLEHIRRSRLLELGYLMTFSWVLYRILVLMIIFFAPAL
jgi:predicted DCC family thiol-disulfide oxidoreductase YuxK